MAKKKSRNPILKVLKAVIAVYLLLVLGNLIGDIYSRLGNTYTIYQYKFQTTLNIYNEDGVEKEFEPRLKGFKLYEKNNFGDSDLTPEFISEGDIPDESID